MILTLTLNKHIKVKSSMNKVKKMVVWIGEKNSSN